MERLYPAPQEVSVVRELSSGVRVIVEEVPGVRLATAYLAVGAGAANEGQHERGAAHFVEHMLFKGNARYGVGEVDEAVDSLGGEINAWTSHDQTVIHLDAHSRHWRALLEILSEMVVSPTFDPEEFELERGVILDEVRGSNDDPGYVFTRVQSQRMWDGHGYGASVGGEVEEVEALTLEAVREFWRRNYCGANMALIVVGDLDAEEVFAEAERLLGGLERGEVAELEPLKVAIRGREVAVVPSLFQEGQFEVAFPICRECDDDAPALEVLAAVLGSEGGGLVGRLQFDEQLVTGAWAQCSFRELGGVLYIGCTPNEEDRGEAIRAIWAAIHEFLAAGVTPEELFQAQASLLSEHRFALQTIDGRASQALWADSNWRDQRAPSLYYARLGAVTAEELLDVARRYITPDRCLSTVMSAGDRCEAREVENASLEAPEIHLAPPETFSATLSCGVQLLVEPATWSSVSSIRLFGLGGRLLERGHSAGRARLWSRSVSAGVGLMDTREFTRRLEMRGSSVGASAQGASMQLGADTLREALDEGLEWVCWMLMEPRFDQGELGRLLREMREWHSTRGDRPGELAWQAASTGLFRGHPYGLSKEGTDASLREISTRQMRLFHERWARGENLVMSVVGCSNPERIAHRLDRLLSGLRGGTVEPYVPLPEAAPGLSSRRLRCGRSQSHYILSYRCGGGLSEDRHALTQLVESLSGAGGRLFTSLRERAGIAYDVSASYAVAPDVGALAIDLTTEPANLPRVREIVTGELERLATEGPHPDELAQGREKLAHSFAEARQRVSRRASDLASWQRIHADGVGHAETERRAIAAVTVDDVRDVARRLLEESPGVEVSTTPLRG